MEVEEQLLLVELERRDAVVSAAQLQLEAVMSSLKEGAMGGPVSHPPLKMSAELEPGLATELQNIEMLDEQQLAALKHEVSLKEEKAWQHEISLREEEADMIEQEEAALSK